MGLFARGDIVLVRFPYSDLSEAKLRPSLVLTEVEYGDVMLVQITSKPYGDRNAVKLQSGDFEEGALRITSYARPGRIVTLAPDLIKRRIGKVAESKRAEVLAAWNVLTA